MGGFFFSFGGDTWPRPVPPPIPGILHWEDIQVLGFKNIGGTYAQIFNSECRVLAKIVKRLPLGV